MLKRVNAKCIPNVPSTMPAVFLGSRSFSSSASRATRTFKSSLGASRMMPMGPCMSGTVVKG